MLLLPLVGAAFAFDHGYAELARALTPHVAEGRVDYAAIGPTGLDPALTAFAAADASGFSRDQAMAFWINAYNALTVDLIAEHPGIASIRDLDGGDPWKRRRFTVAGRSLTLDQIEHQLLRPMGDPRVHAAINCASLGCPPLRPQPFTPEGLDAQLDAASRAWVAHNALTLRGDEVQLNRIFEWFGEDFVPRYGGVDLPGVEGPQEAALAYVLAHAPAPLAERLRAGGYTVTWAEYDWSLNVAKGD